MTGRVIPFPARAPEPDDEREFEELARVRDQAEALIVRGLLEAHGIEVLLRTHVAPSVHPFTVGDQGAVQVLVRREALEATGGDGFSLALGGGGAAAKLFTGAFRFEGDNMPEMLAVLPSVIHIPRSLRADEEGWLEGISSYLLAEAKAPRLTKGPIH